MTQAQAEEIIGLYQPGGVAQEAVLDLLHPGVAQGLLQGLEQGVVLRFGLHKFRISFAVCIDSVGQVWVIAKQAVNALKSEVASLITDKIVTNDVGNFVNDKNYFNAFIVSLAAQWSANEPIVISTSDAVALKKYFESQAKGLLDKGVEIKQVNGIKTSFSISPADGSYKVTFGEEEFMNYFKEFLRPQIVEMLF